MDFGQQYLAVAAVLGLLGAGLWWLRGGGYAAAGRPGRSGRRLEALERLALSPQHSLHVVRAGSSVVLLASFLKAGRLPLMPVASPQR